MTDPRERIQAAFRLNLEQQKNRAKDLLRAVKVQDAAALKRMAAGHANKKETPQGSGAKLADAQFVIARELGFENWTGLKAHIVSMEGERAALRNKQQSLDGDLKTLHLRCGSDIRPTLVEAGFNGNFLEHSNPYCQGPVTTAPDHFEQRARFIADAYGKYLGFSFAEAVTRLREGERLLAASAAEYERIVLWMEHDSFDQLVLVRCLAHYATTKPPRVLELISINRFPGSIRFIGLGQLPAEALRMLWPRRQPVTAKQLALGAETWNALRSDDPRKLAAIMRSATPALPDLAPALHRHLRELPSVENGLGLTEQLVLQILSEDSCSINRVFRLLMEGREPLPWLGDIMLLDIIARMEQGREKIFTRSVAEGENRFKDQLEITDAGRALLRGERDWLSLNPPARWIGGVAIRPDAPSWRWDEARREARY